MKEWNMEQLTNIGLTAESIVSIESRLGRKPGLTEVAVFAGLLNNRYPSFVGIGELNDTKVLHVSDFGIDAVAQVSSFQLSNRDAYPQPDDLTSVADLIVNQAPIAMALQRGYKSNATLVLPAQGDEVDTVVAWAGSPYLHLGTQHAVVLAIYDACRQVIGAGGIPKEVAVLLNLDQANTGNHRELVAAVSAAVEEVAKTLNLVGTSVLILSTKGEGAGVAVTGDLPAESKSISKGMKMKGDLIFILGESPEDIAGSTYLTSYHKVQSSTAPYFDAQKEMHLHAVLEGLIQNELINAAHFCGQGGVYVALLAMAMESDLGFDIVTDSEISEDAFLFGESPSRAVVTVSEAQEEEFLEFMMNSGLSFTLLGHVTKGKLMIDDQHYGFIQEVTGVIAKAAGN